MVVRAVAGGPLSTVGYLVFDRPGGQAILIDAPPGCAERVVKALHADALSLLYVVNTHGHWDHIADNVPVCARTGARLCAHSWDAIRLANPGLGTEGASPTAPLPVLPSRPDRYLQEGDVVQAGDIWLEVWHTPGHSPGSICLYERRAQALFSGDTLFRMGVGRTDFAGGDARQLNRSLLRLASLPDETRVYPGHGIPTTIGDERWLLELADAG